VKSILRKIKHAIVGAPEPVAPKEFHGSKNYWESRYAEGGNSGAGSYNRLAAFKADFLNNLVAEEGIQTVMEFGCGDGNQLTMANYPSYVGLDVSQTAVDWCRDKFKEDTTKFFLLYDSLKPLEKQRAIQATELTLSLDVIYHLVEDAVYEEYLKHLFAMSTKMVILYSSDVDGEYDGPKHFRERKFTKDVERLVPGWKLVKHVPNKYPYKEFGGEEGSISDFYIYSPK